MKTIVLYGKNKGPKKKKVIGAVNQALNSPNNYKSPTSFALISIYGDAESHMLLYFPFVC